MKTKTLYFGILIALLIVPFVTAFGIVSPYMPSDNFVMQPGETKDLKFGLQNMVGNEDLTLQVSLLKGSEIARLTDTSNTYLVKFGTSDTEVNLKIEVPANVTVGTSYPVIVSFATVTSGASAGGAAVGTGIEKNFNVLVGEKTEKPANLMWVWIVAVIIVIVIIIVLLSKKKKR